MTPEARTQAIAAEMAAYIGVVNQNAFSNGREQPTDNDLRLLLVELRFTAAEIEQGFDAAKQIAGC